MAIPEIKQELDSSKKKSSQQTSEQAILGRRSKELIIGLCGAIGAGTKELSNELEAVLAKNSYVVKKIKISKIIEDEYLDKSISQLVGYERYIGLQNAGDELRDDKGAAVLAQFAVKKLAAEREAYLAENPNDRDTDSPSKTKARIAYIIDQLKNPDEVTLLKALYGPNFYLVAVMSTELERKNHLIQSPMTKQEAEDLIERDRKGEKKHGQQVERSAHMADYFIRNVHNHAARLNSSAKRFLEVIHGYNGATPTINENGMYAAFSASLQSACLSRQVGASILNKSGDVLSIGCNDVPAAGGGLYAGDNKDADYRCIFKGKICYNDLYKSRLGNEIQAILEAEAKSLIQSQLQKVSALSLSEEKQRQIEEIIKAEVINLLGNTAGSNKTISAKIINGTRAKSLIEYSRAIHAEMDAILKLGRVEGQSTIGKIMYTTTYPCHGCARHIVAAGISTLYYIEPYEKSLAIDLHDDAITTSGEINKVSFEPFEGVSPARYAKFFVKNYERKDASGNAIINGIEELYHADPQRLDDYTTYEFKVISDLASA